MILWQRWDHGSPSVANHQILNFGFEHFINYCDFIWLSQISFVCVNQIYEILNNYCISSMQHLINHFTYSPSTSSTSPSPSLTITIYHQHHYHHYYHHGLCHHSFHPAMNHPLLHALCPLFVGLSDSVQTYSVIVPAEAVWQPDQLHFDDRKPLQFPLIVH